jgi:predicted  nucleic acid-binding Zn-ribbon protein
MQARTIASPRALATLIALALLMLTAVTPAARAEDELVRKAREKLQTVQQEANAAFSRYRSALAERDQIRAQIIELEQAIPPLRAEEAALRQQVGARAAELYKSLDAGGVSVLLNSDGVEEAARRSAFTEAAAEFDIGRAKNLQRLADELARKQAELEGRRAQLDELVPRLEREKATFEAKVAEANRALEVAEEIGALRALGEPVMGPTVLTPAELVAWYRSTGARPRLSGVTIEQLAAMFVEEGLAENVRGDVAFAQSYIETGGFYYNGADNNFAGLGFCDGCTSETVFPTARDGVRAQIQHLRNYADRRSTAAGLRNAPSPWWYGFDPAVATRNFDTFFAKGWAPTWQMMGRGNWATDPNYAGKVIGVYNRMIAFNKGG